MVRLRARAAATKWPPLPALAACLLFIPPPARRWATVSISSVVFCRVALREVAEFGTTDKAALSNMACRHAACKPLYHCETPLRRRGSLIF